MIRLTSFMSGSMRWRTTLRALGLRVEFSIRGYVIGRYSRYDKYWPADVHMVGKEIVRFIVFTGRRL